MDAGRLLATCWPRAGHTLTACWLRATPAKDLAAVAVDAHRLDGRNVFVPAGDAVCAAATPYAAADNLTYRWVAYENVGGDPAVFTADTRCTRFDSAHGVVVNLTVANTRGKATAVVRTAERPPSSPPHSPPRRPKKCGASSFPRAPSTWK